MSREMRHSGIEWIGEIPKEWNICRLKDVGTLYGGLTGKAGDDFNVEEDDISYMLYIPFTNIFNNDSINPNQLFKVKIEQGEKQNLVQKGDLLFLMSSEDYDGVGKPAIMEEQVDDLGLNSFCKGLRIYNNNTNSKFLFYLLSSHLHRELVRQEAKGFIRINLRQDRLSCCPIFLPPLPEQQKIANYLDKICGEVDEMIALQEQMIEELKAYKQSVITEAVTKGLNPNVPMKDSGIDWIGEIPENWKVIRIKYLLKERKERSDTGLEEPLSMSQKYGLIPTKEMDAIPNIASSFVGAKLVYRHDLVFNKLKAHLGVFAESDYDGLVSPDYAVYYSSGLVDVKYLEYLFKSPQYIAEFIKLSTGVGAGLTRLYTSDLYSIYGIVPPIEIQREIVDYIRQLSSEINTLIAIKQAKIEELKEYKKSVIYEYVTGKKEVV